MLLTLFYRKIYMNYKLSLLALAISIQSQILDSRWQDKALFACAAAAAAGSTYLLSKGYAYTLIATAQTRFATERALLNHYAQFKESWTAALDLQLKEYLKSEIIRLHNTNCHKWSITVLYELAQGKPSYSIDDAYEYFPLLRHNHDIDWYLARLKTIRFLSLYPYVNELNLLIDQLTYIKECIIKDYDYSKEGLSFSQRTLKR